MMLLIFGAVMLVGCIGGVMLGALTHLAEKDREEDIDVFLADRERRRSGRRK